MHKSAVWKKELALLAIPFFFLVVFYFLPLGEIARVSFAHLRGKDFAKVVNWSITGEVLTFTLYQAFLSTLLTSVIGLPAAYLFGRYVFRGKNALRIAATLPFILPTVVVAAGFNALIGPKGWFNLFLMEYMGLSKPPLQILNSLPAILLAHIFYNTSIIIRVVSAALARFDRRLEEAARTLGASGWQTFWHVTFPNLLPSIISAVLLVFLFDFTSFGVILMLGGPRFATLEVEIYIQAVQLLNLPMAAILSFIQLFFTMLITFLVIKNGDSRFAVPIMPKLSSEDMRRPKNFWEKLFIAVMILVLLALLISPIAALVLRSLLVNVPGETADTVSGHALSLMYYRELLINRRRSFFYVAPIQAVFNSLRFAIFSSLVAICLGILMAYALQRDSRFNRVLEVIVMFPLGTSAVTLGLGFFVFFSRGIGSAKWYPWLIPMAHALISLPFVLRVIQPVLRSIPLSLRQAAANLGASPILVTRHIDFPLIRPSLMTAVLYAFTISLGEFGATSFLSRPDMPTMPVAIYRFLSLPGDVNYGQALAMSVIILTTCVFSMMLFDKLQNQIGLESS